jgi:Transglycosylase SLT domain
MPSLLDPTLLRGQQPGEDPTGIQTLLGSIGSALSGGVAQPNDPNTTMAAILAAGNTLANAGAPTLGPPPTTAQAILGALGSARGAAVQTGILPYLQERAQQQLEGQNLDLQVKLFDFNRRVNAANLLRGGVSAADQSGTPVAPGVGAAPAAPGVQPSGDIASLPDVQALPDQTRVAAIQAMTAARLSPAEAAQYARMLMAESQGLHINPQTNKVITSSKGASGVAQVMPQTFLDMAQAHDDVTGSVADLLPNLLAGAHFFHDQVLANNGDLRNAAIAYNAGPQNLTDYLTGKKALPSETTDYLAKVRPGGVQVADASGRTGAPAPPGASVGAPGGPMVNVAGMPGLQVPRDVELAARNQALQSTDPGATYSKAIQDYVEKRALQGNFGPGTVPGVQINRTTGQTEVAPTGVTTYDAPTAAERQKLFPNVPAWQDIVVMRDPTGRITDHKLVDMGPEPQIPISDADARKPVEQGGAGESYRPLTGFTRGARTGLVKPIQIERGAGIAGADANAPGVVTPGQLQQQQQVFQQTQELENQVVHSPVYTQWAQGAQRYDAVLASLNQRTRVGDQAAIESLAKVFDPGAVVTEGKLQMAASYGGVAQQLQNALGKITGESGLPDDVRQQIVNLATSEMKTRDAAVLGQIDRSRASAKAKGLNPDNVLPLFQTTALTKADPEARNAPKGVQLSPPVTLQNGQYVKGEPAQTSGATLPVPSPAQFSAMSSAGLQAIIADGQAHPERYSQDYRTALGAELQRRGGAR